jgi:CheY-like chemotaxis protein
LSAGHISRDTLTVIIFVFVITSVLSTYTIKYNDSIQKVLGALLRKCGLKDVRAVEQELPDAARKEIALLGFHRTASSLVHEILELDQNKRPRARMMDKLVVIDFNPETHESLQRLGIKVIYGDVSHLDTLKHAGIHDIKIVVSTIPDKILVGTDNMKLIKLIKTTCPHAKIIVTAESSHRALQMYKEGADYVLMPHLLAATNLIETVTMMLKKEHNEMASVIKREIGMLKQRDEILQ